MKDLRHHKFGRTNQFNVSASISGLVEKSYVLNNHPVADALAVRASELESASYKWTPEMLALLLHLSDKPAQKSRVQDLETEQPSTPQPSLTWQDIFGDDPIGNASGIWASIDYQGASSDEDTAILSEDGSARTISTALSSTGGAPDVASLESLVISVDETILGPIEQEQSWRSNQGEHVVVQELQVISEILHMLQGLPSSLFECENDIGHVTPHDKYVTDNCSRAAIWSALDRMADLGTQVNALRAFVQRSQRSPLLQRLSARISKRLQDFNSFMSDIGSRYIGFSGQKIVSIMALCEEIDSKFPRYIQLQSPETPLIDGIGLDEPYRILDELCNKTSEAQLYGNETEFETLAHMLLECLDTYMRPVRTWMEDGTLPKDEHEFFVGSSSNNEGLENFWTSRYHLRTYDGHIRAPAFLTDFTTTIFNSGKSVAFLRELGVQPAPIPSTTTTPQSFDYTTILGTKASTSLIPLSTHLHTHLHTYLSTHTNHHTTWPHLRQTLFTTHNLPRTLTALSTIHLSSNGTLFTAFADALFARLDAREPDWANAAILTDLARSCFGEAEDVEPRLLEVMVRERRPLGRSSKVLEGVEVMYRVPWMIANVVRPETGGVYNTLMTLLLQLYRPISLLSCQPLRQSLLPSTSATQESPSAPDPESLPAMSTQALALRHTLLHTLLTLQHHLTFNLHALSLRLHTEIEHAPDLPGLIAAHAEYMTRLARVGMLEIELKTAREAVRGLCDVGVFFVLGGGGGGGDGSGGGSGREGGRIRAMRAQVEGLRSVLVAELRGVDGSEERVGVGWEALAEELEWERPRRP